MENKITKVEYIEQLDAVIADLERKQEFEICSRAKRVKDSILTENVEEFLKLFFDAECFKMLGIPKGSTVGEIEKRIVKFYGYSSIFEYAYRDKMWDCFYRYNQGIYDVIQKVDF